MERLVIGIAGGTGSGKTTVAKEIHSRLKGQSFLRLGQDSYYLDRSELSPEARAKINYDHPDAFDHALLIEHLDTLRRGEAIEAPVYNFVTHTRSRETEHIEPARVIVVEGIMTLVDADLRRRFDIKIFVDTADDVRFIRRLSRDVKDRGRSMQSVIDQWLKVVRLMHREFIEPSKRYADLIIPEGGFNRVAIDVILAKILATLEQQPPG
ncbi:uridine kinase [Candidatus Sumerlaeota bacterium]|nr:uridine kinase [Candidatus Sumerlaeota bacterium]